MDTGPGLRQLLHTVKMLAQTVTELSAKVASLAASLPVQQHTLPAPVTSATDDENTRRLIREEVREMNERQKRVSSLIVHGFDAPDNNSFTQYFDSVTRFFLSNYVLFSDLFCISRDENSTDLKFQMLMPGHLYWTRLETLEALSMKAFSFPGI